MSGNYVVIVQLVSLSIFGLAFVIFMYSCISIKGKDRYIKPSIIIMGMAFACLLIISTFQTDGSHLKPKINAAKTQITRLDQQQVDINTQLKTVNPKNSEYVKLLHQLIQLDHQELQLTQKLNRLQIKQVKVDDNQ